MAFLQASNINKSFGEHQILKNVSFSLEQGQIVGLVGESGCGKSTVAKVISSLEKADSGSLQISGENFPLQETRSKLQRQKVQMIFQNALGSFNPRKTVGDSLKQPLIEHKFDYSENEIVRLLAQVGLGPEYKDRFPHQLSGGQIQRAAIARAIACKPAVLIADEPTSALDLSLRAQVLNLLKDLQHTQNLTCLVITHDLSSLRKLADVVYVMNQGKIVENGEAQKVLNNPQESYTKRLLASIPSLNPDDKTFERFKSFAS